MRIPLTIAALTGAGVVLYGPLSAFAQGPAQCFDKGTLTFVDCPTPAPPPPAPVIPPEPVYNWTGFYGGLHVGLAYMDNEIDLGPTADLVSINGFTSGAIPTAIDNQDRGVMGGVQAGYNYQIDQIVLGGEVDFSFTDLSDSSSISTITFPVPRAPTTTTTTEQTDVNWLSTARARAGYALTPETLVYATGGLALADVDRFGGLTADSSPAVFSYEESETRIGWTVGGGIELGLTETLSIKGEYLYVDLGEEGFTAGPQNAAAVAAIPGGAYSSSDDLQLHLGRIGLNFRF